MPHLNTYAPPAPASLEANRHTPAEEYDHHFYWPVETLSSDRLQLRPFVVGLALPFVVNNPTANLQPSIHAQLLTDGFKATPSLAEWLPLNVNTVDDILLWAEKNRRDPVSRLLVSSDVAQAQADIRSFCYYAIYSAPPGPDADKAPVDQYIFAGGIGTSNSSIADMQSELAWIVILPEFQVRLPVLTVLADPVHCGVC